MPVFDSFDVDLDDFAERCASGDPGVRRLAMLELGEVIEPGAVALLLKGLADPAVEVRTAAINRLTNMTAPRLSRD